MSTAQVIVVSPDVRRATIKVNPGTHMIDVLEEACKKLNTPSDKWQLKHKNTLINLTDPFRMTGLIGGAKLELVEKSRSPAVVNIALRLLDNSGNVTADGSYKDKFRSDTTLWKLLRHFENHGGDPTGRVLNFTGRGIPQTSNGAQAGSGQLYYEMPVLRISGREISSLVDYQKTLSQVGIVGGNQSIQLSFQKTDKTLVDAMDEMSRFFKDEGVEMPSTEKAAPAALSTTQESSAPPTTSTDATAGTTDLPTGRDDASKPLETGLTPAERDPAEPSVSGPVDLDTPVPTGSLQPVGVFAAPTSSTPAAANAVVPDSVYTPTIGHAQLHQKRLLDSSVNKRLKSDAEIEAQAKAEETEIASKKFINIKVRFPDETSAQWTFGQDATGATLYQAVRGVMANDSLAFKLVFGVGGGSISDASGPEHKLISGYKLLAHGVMLNLVWDDSVPAALKKQAFMKSSLASQAKPTVPQPIPDEEEDKEDNPAPAVPAKKEQGGDGTPKKLPKWLKLPGKK